MAGPAQNTYNRWSAARLVRGCRRLTSGFSFRRLSEMRVSGGFLGASPIPRTHAYAGCALSRESVKMSVATPTCPLRVRWVWLPGRWPRFASSLNETGRFSVVALVGWPALSRRVVGDEWPLRSGSGRVVVGRGGPGGAASAPPTFAAERVGGHHGEPGVAHP
jgi:hypothetical protein